MDERGGELAIGLLGDVMLGRGVGAQLLLQDPADVWQRELRELIAGLDAVVCNLECSISERGAPTTVIPGKPFFFRAPPLAVRALGAIGVSAVTCANNHALDFGSDALADTVASLMAAGIHFTGAGPDAEAARRAAVFEVRGQCIAILAVTDHPVEYAAGRPGWGVAYGDLRRGAPGWLLDEISAARERWDLVVVSPHWGPNMTTHPADWQRHAARVLLNAGADLVAGHSAHVFHGAEWLESGPILYDLGDALDDYRVDPELRNDLGALVIWHPCSQAAQLEVVGLCLRYARTELAEDSDAEWIARRLHDACAQLGTRVLRTGEQRFRIECN